MWRVEVVLTEHERDYHYTVAEERSLEELRDLVERLHKYFGARSDRVRIVGIPED